MDPFSTKTVDHFWLDKYKLLNGDQFTGLAVRGWNTKKNEWSWRVVNIDEIDT